MNLLIPFLILCGFAGIITYSSIRERRGDWRREERPMQFAHPPMDLRLKRDPCESCLRWEECNGVDDECPLRKEADTNGKSRQGNDQDCG